MNGTEITYIGADGTEVPVVVLYSFSKGVSMVSLEDAELDGGFAPTGTPLFCFPYKESLNVDAYLSALSVLSNIVKRGRLSYREDAADIDDSIGSTHGRGLGGVMGDFCPHK